jgi:hypothetical protein
MMWHPDARIDPLQFRKVRANVSNGRRRAARLLRWAESFWSLGVIAAGVGTGLGLLSYGHDRNLRVAAGVACGMGLIIAVLANVNRPPRISTLTQAELDNLDPRLVAAFVDLAEPPGGAKYWPALLGHAATAMSELTTECVVKDGAVHGRVRSGLHRAKTVVEVRSRNAGRSLDVTFDVPALARWRQLDDDQILAELGARAPNADGQVHLVVNDTELLEHVLGRAQA